MKADAYVINVHEDFMPLETKSMDAKSRLMLGEKVKKVLERRMKVDAFQICVGRQGDILLRPTTQIPSREAWLYENPKALAKVRKGLSDASQGRTKKVADLEKFLNSL